MSSTFGEMVSSILNETRRISMSDDVSNCILDAISNYETERFWFNETRDTTFSLSTSQAVYTSADHSMIPRLMQIDRFEVTRSANDKFKLRPKTYEYVQEWNESNSSAEPFAYSYWGQALHLTQPNNGYEVRISGIVQLASLSASTDSNAWVERGNGYELIKRRAMALLYATYLRDDANAQRNEKLEIQALDRLRARTTQLQASGEIEPCL
jgi:hypothetical protein